MKAICQWRFLSFHPVLVPFTASLHVIVAATLASVYFCWLSKRQLDVSFHLCKLMNFKNDFNQQACRRWADMDLGGNQLMINIQADL